MLHYVKTVLSFTLLSLVLALFVDSPCSYAQSSDQFQILGTLKNELLLAFVKSQKDHKTTKADALTKAILIDGVYHKPLQLEKNKKIKKAIKNATPIIISNPTPEEMHAITGARITGNLAIITPKKAGEEFDIHLIPPSTTYSALAIHSSKQAVQQIWTVLDNQEKSPKCTIKSGEEEFACPELHKRWTVKYIKPYCWGDHEYAQEQFIDVGFQYDLYYVTDPKPARKYLTVRTVGKGVSPGFLQHNTQWHRGYFQSEVNVSISNSPHENWKGLPLQVEELAPESENRSNSVTTSTGITFSSSLSTGVSVQPVFGFGTASYTNGVSLSRSVGKTSTFKDFTVTLESTPTIDKWCYWMSGADGSNVRRKHQRDPISRFVSTIDELPELAKTTLRPHMEAVYYAEACETGTITMVGKVEQNLVDIQSRLISKYLSRVRERKCVIDLPIDIDFSQVHDAEVIKTIQTKDIECEEY